MGTKAVGLTPDNPRALNNLGRAYWRVGRLGKRGRRTRRPTRSSQATAVTQPWRDPRGRGKPQEAAASYRKALDLNSASYNVWGNLGSALAAIPGREGEAREAYQQAVLLAEKLRQTKPMTELLSLLARYYAYLGSEGKVRRCCVRRRLSRPRPADSLPRRDYVQMLKQRAQA